MPTRFNVTNHSSAAFIAALALPFAGLVISLSGQFAHASRLQPSGGAQQTETWQETALTRPVQGLNPDRELFPGIDASRGDYVSYAIYYWPNSGTGDGMPYISKDGKKNLNLMAKGDALYLRIFRETVIQLERDWEQTRDPAYARRAGQWLRHWFLNPKTRMNPHLRFSQIRPGRTTVSHGGGIIDMANLPLLLDAMDSLRQSDALTVQEWTGIDTWMQDYLDWLIESSQGQHERNNTNNHFVYYMGQLSRLAEILDDKETARMYLDEAFARLDDYIAPDGSQPKEIKRVKGFQYSIYALKAWQQLAAIGDRLGETYWTHESPKGASLTKAYRYLEQFIGPAGKPWPQTGQPFPAEALDGLVKPEHVEPDE